MNKVSIVIVHDGNNDEEKIKSILDVIETRTETYIALKENDNDPDVLKKRDYLAFKDSPLDEEVIFYQIIPHGVVPPSNLYDINSAKCFYGPEKANVKEEDMEDLGNKRCFDNGSKVCLHVKDFDQLKVETNISSLFETDVEESVPVGKLFLFSEFRKPK